MERKKRMRIAAAILSLIVSLNIIAAAFVLLPEKIALAKEARENDGSFAFVGVGEMYCRAAVMTQLIPILFCVLFLIRGKKGYGITLIVFSALFLTVRILTVFAHFEPIQYFYSLFPGLLRAAAIVLTAIYLKAAGCPGSQRAIEEVDI